MKSHHATSANGNGHAAHTGETNTTAHDANGQAADTNRTVLEQAQLLRGVLRDALSKTNELVLSIKRHKRKSRLVESTLASLRQLQTIDT